MSNRPKSPAAGYLLIILAAFILSRLIFHAVGVRFDASPLYGLPFTQYIDIELLRTNFLQSIYYLHFQPPFFNIFLGVVVNAFPTHGPLVFHLCYLAMTLAAALAAFFLMVRLGVRHWLATAVTIFFIFSPTSILYEKMLFYTWPIMTLLTLSALFLHRWLSHRRPRDAYLFFAFLGSITLTSSIFHLAWFLLVGGVVCIATRGNRKQVVLAAIGPLLLIVLAYGKNLVVFGSFSISPHPGDAWRQVTTAQLPEDQLRSLVDQGKLSPLALVSGFAYLDQHSDELTYHQATGIPALDQRIKSTGGPNWNNLAYIKIHEERLRNALYVLRHYPKTYLRGVALAFYHYFLPSTSFTFIESNYAKIKPYARFCSAVFAGRFRYDRKDTTQADGDSSRLLFNLGLFLVVTLPVLFVYACLRVVKTLRKKHRDLPAAITVLFLTINIAWLTGIGNTMSVGENNRFRVLLLPFFLTLLGLLINNRILPRRGPSS